LSYSFFVDPHEIWFTYMGFYTLCHSSVCFSLGVKLLRADDNRQLSVVNKDTLQHTISYQKQDSYPVNTLVLPAVVNRPEGEANRSPISV
jgi:hypothetical protein